MPEKTLSVLGHRFTPKKRSLAFVGARSFRMVALGICQHKQRLDSFLSSRFLTFLFTDRLCYMTLWFVRAPRISAWFSRELVRVYRGRRWKGVRLTPFHRGQRLGAFARTRILAVFQQAKTRKKRAKAAAAKAASAASQQRVDQIKRFKGRGGRPLQGLRVLNKALVGSRWVKAALADSVE
jgi:hypothetical protein